MIKITITTVKMLHDEDLVDEMRRLRKLGFPMHTPAEALRGMDTIFAGSGGTSIVKIERVNSLPPEASCKKV